MTTRRLSAEMREQAKEYCDGATDGPWAWEHVGEKTNGFIVGLACSQDGKPLEGRLPEEEFTVDTIIRKDLIGEVEESAVNYGDAEFICYARHYLPDALHDLDVADQRIDELEQAVFTLNSFDAPAEVQKLRAEVRAAQATISTLQELYDNFRDVAESRGKSLETLHAQIKEAQSTIAAMREAVRRLLIWPILHQQDHPEYNGNRFDDEQFGRRLLSDTAQLAADYTARIQAEARADERRRFSKDWLKSKIADALIKSEIASAFEDDGEPLFNFDPQDISLLSDMLSYALAEEMER